MIYITLVIAYTPCRRRTLLLPMMLYLSLLLLWIPWWLINNRKREVNKITSERTNSVGALATTGGLIMYDLAIYRSLPLYDMINAVIPDAPMIILSPILALSVSWVVRVILSWMWPTMRRLTITILRSLKLMSYLQLSNQALKGWVKLRMMLHQLLRSSIYMQTFKRDNILWVFRRKMPRARFVYWI